MTCFRPDGHLTDAALTALVRGDCLEELAKKHYHAISARLSISQEEVRSAWSWRNIWPTATSASSGTQSCCLRDRC